MLQLNFTPFPVLHTNRLLLRKILNTDAPELFVLRSDERVLQFIGREPAKSIEEVKAFIQKISEAITNNESILWGISLQEDPAKLIGSICLWNLQPEHYRAEIGYNLHPDHWGKGIMTEAIGAVVGHAFKVMKFHSIEARTNPENIGSGMALLKAGFVKEGHLREEFFFNGRFHDAAIYCLLESDPYAQPDR